MPALIVPVGKKKKGVPSMPPPEMPNFKAAAKAPSRFPAPPKRPAMEAETDERGEHDLTGEKFSAERLIFFDGSETCASCHHFDEESGGCKIGSVEISDPASQGCYCGYQPAENHEQAETGDSDEEEEAA